MKKYCLIGFENCSGVLGRPFGAPIILTKAKRREASSSGTTFDWYKKTLDKSLIKRWTLKNMREYANKHWSDKKDEDVFRCGDGTMLYIVPENEIEIAFAEIKLKR